MKVNTNRIFFITTTRLVSIYNWKNIGKKNGNMGFKEMGNKNQTEAWKT